MPTPAGSDASAPTAIGRYVLRGRIATGATGYVYAAEDRAMDREVAVKVIAADLADEPEARERFYREARITAQLSHPNIVRVLDVGEDHGRPFIAMERLIGLPLDAHLKANPTLPLSSRIDLIVQLYSGLQAAHDQGTVHRDLKPGNIFVEKSGCLKILDFGLARLQASTLTASGVVVGSPGFMSPEQAEGRRVDARSDIFSAAAVGYLIVARRAPFAGRTLPQTLHAILQEAPAPIAFADAPPVLARVLYRALEKSPDARYQTCADVLRDLARVKSTVVHP
jgi:serine/threonine protein kinase